jgi:hypothetical protein
MRRAIRSLLRSSTPLLLLLVSIGCDAMNRGFDDVGKSTRPFFEFISGKTALKAAQKMENPDSPDARWQGMTWLVSHEYGRKPPYTTRYQQIAQNDPDWLVRAMAVRALNRSRDKSATPIFIKALEDSATQVRLEAAKALANVPDAKATPALLKIAGNASDDRDVRIAAADALRHYKSIEVARVLVNQLQERNYGLAWQSRHTLKALTGRDLRYDEAAWLAFLTKDRPFG